MKRVIISCLSIFLLTLDGYSQQTIDLLNNYITDERIDVTPFRNVTEVSDGIIVTYNFDRFNIYADNIYTNAYLLGIKGFGTNNTLYEPALPFRWDSFVVPSKEEVFVSVIDSAYVDMAIEISPSRPTLLNCIDKEYSITNVPPISSYMGFYPSNIVTCTNVQTYRGIPILSVCVYPVKYNYNSKIARIFKKISYKISYNKDILKKIYEKQSNLIYDDMFLRNTTLNHIAENIELKSQVPTNVTKTYMIITTPKYIESVNNLVEWKKTLGYNVIVSSEDTWNENSIKQKVLEVYSANPSLYYLLIVGDHEDVPAGHVTRTIYNHLHDYYSDYGYTCLNNNYNTPDISCGRLPINTIEECDIVIEKIIEYEKNPIPDKHFYRTGLNCAYFQDGYWVYENGHGYKVEPNGVEDRRFAKTSEEIRNCLVRNHNIAVERVYCADDTVQPTRWSNSYSNGEYLPDSLRKPHFSWNGTGENINQQINNGVFYVLHRDHGGNYSWGSPRFTTTNISNLSNGKRLPVVFSLNCLTGEFNGRTCFSESFLRKENGGCVAIYCATDTSYSGYNDALALGLFDAIWNDEDLIYNFSGGYSVSSHTSIYSLGDILNQGKKRMDETYSGPMNIYTRELFHLFGDPSMEIYTDQPTSFGNISISRNTSTINVDLNGEVSKISFYDRTENSVISYLTDNISYNNSNNHDVVVCVNAHNKIPYIDDPKIIYLQKTTVTGVKTYEADEIKAGTAVTNMKPQGKVTFNGNHITLKGKEVTLEGETEVTIGTTFEILPQ